MNDELCRRFIANPKVYPDNPNKRLIFGKGPYNRYVELCEERGYHI